MKNELFIIILFFVFSFGYQRKCRVNEWMYDGPTGHELGEGLGAGGGDRKGQFVHSDSVSHGQTIDPSVGNLSGQQLPQ